MTEYEWLGNNKLSLDIWNKKYRYKDETFQQWLDRVSRGNSEIRRLILEKKFLFGGRTLANREVPNAGSFSNCFIAGSKVLCKRGLINIEDIVIGDQVLSSDGRFHVVNDVMCRYYKGDLYKIESHEIYAPIVCTPNHKFLTNHGWKRADRIFPQGVSYTGKGQDMLKTAYFDGDSYFYKAGEGEIVDLTEGYIEDEKHRIVYSDENTANIEIYCNVSPVKEKKHYIWKEFSNPINHKVALTSDFLYFIGRWIGDGSITCRKGQNNPSILQIVFNATTERDAAERCQKIGEEVFGICASVTETKQNVIAVRFEHPFISSWFLKNFGEKCDGKFIPDKFLGNRDILCGIIDSDGSINTHGAVKLVLKNKRLLQWVKDTCYLNGINTGQIKDISYRQEATGQLDISVTQANAKLNKYLTKEYHDKRQNKIARGNSEYIYIPSIEVLEDQECNVYNISVEGDHTYTVNGVIVHNCYSIGYVPDSLDGIMDVAHKIAMTFKAQGGQGLSLSKIRPKGSMIAGQYPSDGIVPFMNIFNTVTESVSQGGSRKGALLMSLDAWHPEALTFIRIKEDLNKINKANLSIEVDNEFMQWVEHESIDITAINKSKVAKEVFEAICESAWKSAEPGILFVNRLRNYNLMEFVDEYQIETCNPCSEQPLPKHGACNLCSINLSEYVTNPFTKNAHFSFDKLKNDIWTIVAEMDKVLEENLDRHALPEQRAMAEKYRNIGIGIMGLADMLVKLGIRYGSEDSIKLARGIMLNVFREAVFASVDYGTKLGSFPGYDPKVWDSTIIWKAFNKSEIANFKKINALRNCSLISIAPTGSIGTFLQISTGCEPFFALEYNRRTESMNKETYKVEVKAVEEYRKITDNQGELPNYFVTAAQIPWKERIDMQAALQDFCDTAISSTVNLPKETTVEEVKELYKYAWKQGLKGITIYREGSRDPILSTDNNSSKNKDYKLIATHTGYDYSIPVTKMTINSPENYFVKYDLSKLGDCSFMVADKPISNLDGTYTYSIIPINIGLYNSEDNKPQITNPHKLERGEVIKTNDHWLGLKRTLTTGCGSLHVNSYWDPETGELRECFLSKGSTGGCQLYMIGLSRMISLAARGGISIEDILDQLKSCGVCPSYAVRTATKSDTSKGSCCPVAVGNALREMHKEMQDIICECKGVYSQEVIATALNQPFINKMADLAKSASSSLEECPKCHEKSLIHSGGCIQCTSCGYSKCD